MAASHAYSEARAAYEQLLRRSRHLDRLDKLRDSGPVDPARFNRHYRSAQTRWDEAYGQFLAKWKAALELVRPDAATLKTWLDLCLPFVEGGRPGPRAGS